MPGAKMVSPNSQELPADQRRDVLEVHRDELRILASEKLELEKRISQVAVSSGVLLAGTLAGIGALLGNTSVPRGVLGSATLVIAGIFFCQSLLVLGYLYSLMRMAEYQYGILRREI